MLKYNCNTFLLFWIEGIEALSIAHVADITMEILAPSNVT